MVMTTYYAAQLGIALSVVDECGSHQQIDVQQDRNTQTSANS